jgi:hypothetical protein
MNNDSHPTKQLPASKISYICAEYLRRAANMNATPAKTLLSGASGMLGSALRQALAIPNFPVLQLVRRGQSSVDRVLWDPAATPAISPHETERLEDLTAAIHLSGANVAAHRWNAAYKHEMAESRVESTRALARTLAGLRQPPQMLLVASATGIYGSRGDEILDESSAPGTGFLADLCRQWEDAGQPAVEAGIRVVHLRFGVILGPLNKSMPGALSHLVPLFRLGLGGPLGPGTQWMSWISLADAIAAIVFAIRSPTLSGPLNVTSPNPVTNAQFTRALANAVHRPAFLRAPAFALRLALGQMADEALLASARVLPAKLQAAGFQFSHPTIYRALIAALTSTSSGA